MIKQPLVSVIMVAFNEPKNLINQAIDSILNQSLTDFEFIIVDESSNKETIYAIKKRSLEDNRIKILHSNQIGFFSKSLNFGLKNAKGIFIARMDPDDVSHKSRLKKQVHFLENNPKYSLVGSAVNIIDINGKKISSRSYPSSSIKLRIWSLFRNPLAHPTVMFRRSIIDQGYFYDDNFSKAEDLELWLRLMKKDFKFYNLQNHLLSYRTLDNFSSKRAGDNFKYNYKARKKNFSWKSFIPDFISLFFSKIYSLLPIIFVKTAYKILE